MVSYFPAMFSAAHLISCFAFSSLKCHTVHLVTLQHIVGMNLYEYLKILAFVLIGMLMELISKWKLLLSIFTHFF